MRIKQVAQSVVCWFFLVAGVCQAAGFVTPISPVDELRQEVGFFSTEVDLEAKGSAGADLTSKQVGAYVQAEFPLLDAAAFYVRLGGSSLQLDTLSGSTTVFDSGYRPFGGAGVKWVLGSNPLANLGCFAEGNYYARFKDEVGGVKYEYEGAWELTAGVALQLQYDGVGIYAGPVGYLSRGELESNDGTSTTSLDYKGVGQAFRGGIMIPFGSLAYLTLDGTFGDRQGWGASLNFVGPSL